MPPAGGGKCLLCLAGIGFDLGRCTSLNSVMHRLPQHRLIRRHAAWWTLLVGLTVTAVLGWTLEREAETLDRQRLALRVAEVTAQLDARLEKSEMLVQHLRDYLMLSGENRNPVFAQWCYENGLTINCPWVLGLAVATNCNEVDLRTVLPKPPAEWDAEDWDVLGSLRDCSPIECQLSLQSKVDGGRQFLSDYNLRCSFNYSSREDPLKGRWSLADAIRGSRLGMSRRESVMLDANGKEMVGTLYFAPVYRPGLADYLARPVAHLNHHRSARWMHLSAVIVAPLDFRRLTEAVWEGSTADLGVEVFSSTNIVSAETWLNGSGGTPKAADPAFKPYLSYRHAWPMLGHRFTLFFYTTPLFEAQSPRRLARTAAAAGLVVTLLATALVGVFARARNREDSLTRQILEGRDALAAAQRERVKISRDLHDGTIQSLYAIQLGLAHTAGRMRLEPAHAGSELSLAQRELDAVIAEIRQFITTEGESGKPVDLGTVLEALAQRMRTGSTARIGVRCDPAASARVTGDEAVQLANIAREALSNALRHGRPERVDMDLRLEKECVVLEIVDDGEGFNPEAGRGSGLGLASMAARAREAGGALVVVSSRGKGTHVVVRLAMRLDERAESDEREMGAGDA